MFSGNDLVSRIIGEDKALSIKVGAEALDPAGEDIILIRGTSSDVDRAVKEVLKIVENAKNDEIVNSFVRYCLFIDGCYLTYCCNSFSPQISILTGNLLVASSVLKVLVSTNFVTNLVSKLMFLMTSTRRKRIPRRKRLPTKSLRLRSVLAIYRSNYT